MDPERWNRIEGFYHAALEHEPGGRAAFLAEACPEPDLRREVESLLGFDGSADSMLEHPAWSKGFRAGDRVGPYEILDRIGKGGMGEVWRARDPRLNREVAIKISAQQFSDRFEREARSIAALNHSNICTLFDVGPNYLVMELVEGATLAERVAQGPLPLEEALAIARQIADALEAAHEKGIVHRDLKPANIKIRPDGSVKVLDFGLAKSVEQEELTSDSPTMLSAAGMILGTAGYMAPEQARGKVVDKRADIWAFGVVLYEMLTGKRPFEGETTTEILSEVIKAEPSWTGIPPRAQRLLKSCLKKDPKKRLRDIGDAWQLLEDGPESALPSRSRLAWAVAAVLAVIAAISPALLYLRPKPPAAAVQRFNLAPPEIGVPVQLPAVSVSPDGTRLAYSYQYVTATSTGGNRLWVRRLDSVEFQLLDDTKGVDGLPFWSPDSRFIAFGTSDGKLRKIETAGGPAQTLADATDVIGGFWTTDGRIIFSGEQKAGLRNDLFQVPAAGGAATPLANVERPNADEGLYTPVLLPDRRHFLYLRAGSPRNDQHDGIYLGSLDDTPPRKARKLLGDYSAVVYAPSPDPDLGYLLFVRGSSRSNNVGALMAQPFDLRKLDLAGEPVPVAERVSATGGFAASGTGVLAYGAGAAVSGDVQLTLFDRQGKVLGPVGEPTQYGGSYPAFSPDGARVAASRLDRQSGGRANIWVTDLTRGVSARFASGLTNSGSPIWSPDGNQIAFGSTSKNGTNDLYSKLSNGGGDEELLLKAAEPDAIHMALSSWSRDGRFLLFTSDSRSSTTIWSSWLLPFDSRQHAAGKPFVFQRGARGPRFSPDMRWVSYTSNESGTFEIYVRPFDPNSPTGSPPGGGKWLVSKGGGGSPRWNGNGKELFYAAPDGTIMSVDISANPAFHPGIPKPLFKTKARRGIDRMLWDVSSDGMKFLLPIPVAADTAAPLTIVLNWQAGLKK